MVLYCGPQFSLARAFDMRSCYSALSAVPARAQVATSRNVGCFLRLMVLQIIYLVLRRRNW